MSQEDDRVLSNNDNTADDKKSENSRHTNMIHISEKNTVTNSLYCEKDKDIVLDSQFSLNISVTDGNCKFLYGIIITTFFAILFLSDYTMNLFQLWALLALLS